MEASLGYDTLSEIEWEQVTKVWDLLEDGKTEEARAELRGLLQKRPGHPDLRIVEAAVSLDEGEPGHAIESLKGAERSADPALFFHLRSFAAFELGRFDNARDDAERALAIREDLADTHDILGRTLEHLGDVHGAKEHAETAHDLDPETFPLPLEVSDEEFDAIVKKSVDELPAPIRKHLDDLPILVEPLPRRGMLDSENPPLSPGLLGLFVGRPLPEQTHGDVPSAPGAIFLFRRNLLRAAADRAELDREIRTTVQHEVGHLLGLDEDDLERLGLG